MTRAEPLLQEKLLNLDALDWYILECALENGTIKPPLKVWTVKSIARDQDIMPGTAASRCTKLSKLGLLVPGHRSRRGIGLSEVGHNVLAASRGRAVTAWVWRALEEGRTPARYPTHLRR